MKYVLDTNILLHYLRASNIALQIDVKYNPLNSNVNEAIVCVVSVGELKAIAKMNHWGRTRLEQLELLLDELIVTDIHTEDMLERYAEIDAFSNGKLMGRSLGMSSRNMGKNDLWIAATASLLDATLLTTDQDFNHLHNEFLQVACIKV
jgi:tRNA(fMet)-specific endonuclease VapC